MKHEKVDWLEERRRLFLTIYLIVRRRAACSVRNKWAKREEQEEASPNSFHSICPRERCTRWFMISISSFEQTETHEWSLPTRHGYTCTLIFLTPSRYERDTNVTKTKEIQFDASISRQYWLDEKRGQPVKSLQRPFVLSSRNHFSLHGKDHRSRRHHFLSLPCHQRLICLICVSRDAIEQQQHNTCCCACERFDWNRLLTKRVNRRDSLSLSLVSSIVIIVFICLITLESLMRML